MRRSRMLTEQSCFCSGEVRMPVRGPHVIIHVVAVDEGDKRGGLQIAAASRREEVGSGRPPAGSEAGALGGGGGVARWELAAGEGNARL